MPDPTESFEAIAAALRAEQEREALRTAAMFTTPAICHTCGAQVAFPERHKAFHDALDRSATYLLEYARGIGRAAGVIPDA